MTRTIKLTLDDLRLLTEPCYHDFAELGLPTPQREGNFAANQRCKQEHLLPLVDRAVAEAGPRPSLLELFCADGYYGCRAAQRGARVHGVDRDEAEVARANLMARVLGLRRRARFHVGDVFAWDEPADVVMCAGGLYHLEDPAALLRRLRELTRSSLVVQTVYHLGVDDPGYFETPAPGWSWGCRFSLGYLRNMLVASGWEVVSEATNELEGNEKPKDRGAAYFLCR